jgi:DNA invertase Pin-like site-specific DNA recombinase
VERCKSKVKELSLEVLEVFSDEGFSAGVESRVCRPAFDEMISKAKSGTFGHILCLNTSRFSRDPTTIGYQGGIVQEGLHRGD